MQRSYLIWGILSLCTFFSAKAQVQTDSIEVYFATASQTLAPSEIEKVRAFVLTIPVEKTYFLAVKGYTDNRGNRDFNQRLSRARALAVQQLLESYGIPADNFIEVSGRGEIDPNATEQDARLNRKVTIRLFRPMEEILAEQNPAPPDPQPTRGMSRSPKPAPAPVDVNACNETAAVYTLDDGTLVTLGACCFGSLNPQEVQVQLEAITDPAEMIASDIQTITVDGYYLSSAGMLMVTLRDPSGQLITQTEGNTCMTIRIPAATQDPYVRIYYAFQKSELDRITWQSSLNKPAFRQIDGKPYYEIRTQRPVGVSFQKPLDNPRENGLKRMYVQIKGFDPAQTKVFLAGPSTAVGSRWTKNGLAYFRLPAVNESEAFLAVIVDSDAGRKLMISPLTNVKKKKGPNKQPLYQVKKKGFIDISSDEQLLQELSAMRY